MSNEGEYYEASMKDKDGIISELKNKINILDKENVEMNCKIKNLESKLKTSKEDYETTIEELEEKISEIKKENKNIRIASSK